LQQFSVSFKMPINSQLFLTGYLFKEAASAYQPGCFILSPEYKLIISLSRTALSCAVLHVHILCKTSLRKSNPGFSPRLPKTIFNELLYNSNVTID